MIGTPPSCPRPSLAGSTFPPTPGCKGITGTNAFSLPAPGVFGNSGRNTLRGPGLKDLDVSLSRNFTFAERFKLQFRAEAFNLTNTVLSACRTRT